MHVQSGTLRCQICAIARARETPEAQRVDLGPLGAEQIGARAVGNEGDRFVAVRSPSREAPQEPHGLSLATRRRTASVL